MIRRLLLYAVLAVMVAIALANPRRPALKRCGSCGAMNEPDRSSCITCGARF